MRARAYLSTEVANAERALTGAVNLPVQGLLGGGGVAGAAPTTSAATAAAGIVGCYQSLVTHGRQPAQLGSIWTNVTAPAGPGNHRAGQPSTDHRGAPDWQAIADPVHDRPACAGLRQPD